MYALLGILVFVAASLAHAVEYGPMPPMSGPPEWITSPAPMLAQPTVDNGGFETGTFAGWNVVNEVGSSGSWYVYSGTSSPLSGFQIPAPPEGRFAAVADQTSPSSHILYQDITLPAGGKEILSFILYYENRNAFFYNPPTLDFFAAPNQQYRVDIMDPAAPIDSVAPGDVLMNLFQTQPGDPLSLPPTPMFFDVSQFAGSTVRLRFAEVDNQYFFQASVDAVRFAQPSPVPALSLENLAVLVGALLLMAGYTLRAYRLPPR